MNRKEFEKIVREQEYEESLDLIFNNGIIVGALLMGFVLTIAFVIIGIINFFVKIGVGC